MVETLRIDSNAVTSAFSGALPRKDEEGNMNAEKGQRLTKGGICNPKNVRSLLQRWKIGR